MPLIRRALNAALAAPLFALCLLPARAQETPPPAPSPTPARFSFIVTDQKGKAVGTAGKDELRVTVGGVEQVVGALAKDESPLSYGLVVDNSGSMRALMGAAIAAAKFIVASGRPEDEGFVVRFVSSDRISMLQDFTADSSRLDRALGQMYVEGGQTALVDALHLSAENFGKKGKGAAAGPRRRALILISDGEDRASFYKSDQLLKRLQEEDIRVFCIGLTGELDNERGFISKSRRDKSVELLDRLAKETGGRAFYATKVGELNDAALQIVAHLRAEYVVEFVPAGKNGGAASGKLEIKLRDAGKTGRAVVHKPTSMQAAGDSKQKP